MKYDKCFAREGRKCQILMGGKCYGKCAFYKTVEEHAKSSADAFDRIARLPFTEQRYIAEKHYGGHYPWVSGVQV